MNQYCLIFELKKETLSKLFALACVFRESFRFTFAATTVAFAQSMLQQPLSRTFRGEREKPVVTWELMRKTKCGIGNVFAHRLFTHIIRPPEQEETNIDRKWKEERRRRGREQETNRQETSGFRHESVALSMETLQGDWWTWTIASFAALPRIFRGFFGKFGCPHSNLQSCIQASCPFCSKVLQT